MSAEAANTLGQLAEQLAADEAKIATGGGQKAIERQRAKGRLFVRDRLRLLLDENSPWLELGLWAGWKMYDEWGGAPAAGVVCGIGTIEGRRHVVIANDATVKAGAFFPATVFFRPLRVRAFVLVRCPRTGKPRRWRSPR